MILSKLRLTLAAAAMLAATLPALHAQHGHLNTGVIWAQDGNGNWVSTNQLGFKNANDFAYNFGSGSGYTMNLASTSLGAIATYYGGTAYLTAWTPSALSGDSGRRFSSLTDGVPNYLAWENYEANSNGTLPVAGAAGGSYLRLTLVSIERLSGSATSFSIWQDSTIIGEWTFDGDGAGTLASGGSSTFNLTGNNSRIGPGGDTAFPDASLPANNTYPGGWSQEALDAGFRWNVPNANDPSIAVDPYGHIHGRSFATNGDGDFRIVWQATDANGIHADSDLLTMRFLAVPEPSTWLLIGLGLGVMLFVLRRRRSSES